TLEVVKLAFRMILVSPNFLYRVEPEVQKRQAVTPHELATRLSYFVWASTPDDQLLGHADDGTLAKPEVFAAELARMLDDDKADGMAVNFGDLGLDARAVAEVIPDKMTFPTFDDNLRAAMADETHDFFRTFLHGDRHVREMVHTDFTFANERLGRHYGAAF